MGGVHKTDLMSDVTFMVVGERYSDKYNFAVQNRANMTFLRPGGIAKIFERWRSGLDIDIEHELEEAKLGVFEGYKICSTNINMDPDRRILIDMIISHGGEYMADLTKSVTQLISPVPSGRKYNFAKKWDIWIVSPMWVMMSVERGAALSEKYFTLDLPKENIGNGAWLFHFGNEREERLVKRSIVEKTAAHIQMDDSISDIYVPIKRKKSVATSAWNTILGDLNNHVVKKESTVDKDQAAWDDKRRDDDGDDENEEHENREENERHLNEGNNNRITGARNQPSEEGLFVNQTFSFFGFNNNQLRRLQNIVTSHRGLVADNNMLPTLIIVNSQMSTDEYRGLDLENKLPGIPIYTEWTLERSLHKKRLSLDIWGQYVIHRDIAGFDNLNISLSGYAGVELLHLERLIKLLGGKYQSVFVASGDLLISTPKSSKFKYALVWNVPIVNHLWIWGCASRGTILPLDCKEWVIDGKERIDRELGVKLIPSQSDEVNGRLGTEPTLSPALSSTSYSGPSPVASTVSAPAEAPVSPLQAESLGSKELIKSSKSGSLNELLQLARSDTEGLSDKEVGKLWSNHEKRHDRRIVGRAAVSATSSMTVGGSVITDTSERKEENASPSTQVSYLDVETQNERMKLLETLGGSESFPDTGSVVQEEMGPAVDLLRKRPRRTTREVTLNRRLKAKP